MKEKDGRRVEWLRLGSVAVISGCVISGLGWMYLIFGWAFGPTSTEALGLGWKIVIIPVVMLGIGCAIVKLQQMDHWMAAWCRGVLYVVVGVLNMFVMIWVMIPFWCWYLKKSGDVDD